MIYDLSLWVYEEGCILCNRSIRKVRVKDVTKKPMGLGSADEFIEGEFFGKFFIKRSLIKGKG